jgi:galactofuranosylgalactofuranosylrhamnosyl-N-acetylglucosaminyl-diphospho-decaprenol beta-1,5/1,6-galactofuranosyltransferase
VFPHNPDIDILPLYWDPDQASFAAPQEDERAERAVHVAVGTPNLDLLLDRRRIVVEPGTRASTATYFNAFPASYWRRWTAVRTVTLTVAVQGSGRLAVYRSTPDGRIQRVDTASVDSGETGDLVEVSFELPLSSFGDGGWYWFDLIAGHDELVLEHAEYSADIDVDTPGTVCISITTFNRADWCVGLLGELADGLNELPELDGVLVVDQGTQKVVDEPAFPQVAKRLGHLLRIVDQQNVGGSGGFARGQFEALHAESCDYVLLLDDDVQIEPEGIRRALVFADSCRRPTIVGGHMLSRYSRAQLLNFGEVVDRYRFFWGAAGGTRSDHDFAVDSLRATPWLHRRCDVDYNAWWMCLVPIAVVRQVGLAMPYFIKWDDCEYGLRAQSAGIPTVTLPGAAVWHMPFVDKDDSTDWQAYFHQRNRWVTALLYSPYERGGSLPRHSFMIDVKHLLSLQYSAVDLRLRALEDVLSGPDHLHASIDSALPSIRKVRAKYSDAIVEKDLDGFPPPRRSRPPRRGREPEAPHSVLRGLAAAGTGALRQVRPVENAALGNPQALVPSRDAKWWRLSHLDSAIVTTADGTGASLYQRDPRQFRNLLLRSLALHRRLVHEWPRLEADYRAAHQMLTSDRAWAATFDRLAAPNA